ncbi:MAG: sugar ABC transporter permease [Pseudomonadota bacterium]
MEFLANVPDAVWSQIGFAIVSIILGITVCVGFFWGANFILDKSLPSAGPGAETVRRDQTRTAIRPWIFLFPALLLLTLYLLYPFVATVIASFMDKNGQSFVGLENYVFIAGQEAFWEAVKNNFLWIIIVPAACTFFGLVIAVMADRLWWGTLAKTLIFLPMAISFVGAAVIWKFVYEFQSGDVQIGLLNAVVQLFGGEPRSYIDMPFWNNLFLMVILIWIQTGFAMVILSAALRGIPEETLEAATLDGANGFQQFWRIMVPQIMPTVLVVWTTITILVLKVFDIVFTMTDGQWDTQVLANYMFFWLVRGDHDGYSSVVALAIMVAVLPIMIWNIRNAAKDEGAR